jgi:hypothetical protein
MRKELIEAIKASFQNPARFKYRGDDGSHLHYEDSISGAVIKISPEGLDFGTIDHVEMPHSLVLQFRKMIKIKEEEYARTVEDNLCVKFNISIDK